MEAREEILEKLFQAVVNGNSEEAKKGAEEAVKMGIAPLDAIEYGLTRGINIVGEKFEIGEIFLPQLILSADAMKAGLEVLKPELMKRRETAEVGRIILGTVEGDIHEIGKSVVGIMLSVAGFEVIDIGVDVSDQIFIDKVKEIKPIILGLSALMTTTRVKQKDVIDALNKERLKECHVMVGGAAVTPEWADKIGADAYGENAVDAVQKAKLLLKNKK